jgi:hypothetical protein
MYQLKSKDVPVYREKILNEDQNGRCAICGNIPKIPCLDHHHKKRVKGTGQIRGVVCSNCNVFLAKSENNAVRYGISHDELPDILRSMANYLERKQYELIHPSEKTQEPKLQKTSYNVLKRVYNGKARFPPYPKSGKMTKPLRKLFKHFKIEPKFYKK